MAKRPKSTRLHGGYALEQSCFLIIDTSDRLEQLLKAQRERLRLASHRVGVKYDASLSRLMLLRWKERTDCARKNKLASVIVAKEHAKYIKVAVLRLWDEQSKHEKFMRFSRIWKDVLEWLQSSAREAALSWTDINRENGIVVRSENDALIQLMTQSASLEESVGSHEASVVMSTGGESGDELAITQIETVTEMVAASVGHLQA
eukprot:gene23559-29788_t